MAIPYEPYESDARLESERIQACDLMHKAIELIMVDGSLPGNVSADVSSVSLKRDSRGNVAISASFKLTRYLSTRYNGGER